MVLRSLAIFSISMLLAAQAYNLSRAGGEGSFGLLIAFAMVLGLFVSEALLTASITQQSVSFKKGLLVSLILLACGFGEWMVYKASEVAMAVGGFRQIDSELEGTYEMMSLKESLNVQLWNSYNCGKTAGCDPSQFDQRADQIREQVANLRSDGKETSTQMALKETGNDVGSVAQNFAMLLQLISIILATALGLVWGVELPEEREREYYDEPEEEDRHVEDIDDMMEQSPRHPIHDYAPGYKRQADFATQLKLAESNVNSLNSVEDIKQLCKCGQPKARKIRDNLIAQGLWKSNSKPKMLNLVEIG